MQAIATQRGGAVEVFPKGKVSAVAFGVALAFAGWGTGLLAVATGFVLAAAERDRKSGRHVSIETKVIRALAVVGGYAAILIGPLAMGVIGTHMIAGMFIVSLVVRAERTLGDGTRDEVRAARRAFYLSGIGIAVLITAAIAGLAVAVFLR